MITVTQVQEQMREQAAVAEKRRKRDKEDQAEREREQPLTAAHIVGEAMMDGAPPGPAEKAIADRGATAGPGEGVQPGQIDASDFRRPYIREGHGAPLAPVRGADRRSSATSGPGPGHPHSHRVVCGAEDFR